MDHTAGIPALPPSVDVVTGPEEADDVYQVFGFGHLGQTPRLHELDFTVAREMPPLGAAIDIHGDGSLWAISTPGHSRGHVSFVVNATRGPVLLTGDASHFAWGFEHDVAPMAPSADDQANARASLQRLRQFAAAYPEVTVFFGHEAPRRR
jgi:glyoxylase-like metal-dependent hydrolase (beta-lactamase superfamily II)